MAWAGAEGGGRLIANGMKGRKITLQLTMWNEKKLKRFSWGKYMCAVLILKRYLILGQTNAGRYLAVVFVWKPSKTIRPITARDMDEKERNYFARRGK